MQRLNVLLALFAGLLGGIVSSYLLPEQVQTTVAAVPSGVAAPRWFVAALLGGTAVLTAMTAALPTVTAAPASPSSWSASR